MIASELRALSATVSRASFVQTGEAYAMPVWDKATAMALGGGGIVTMAVAVSCLSSCARIAATPSKNARTAGGSGIGPIVHPEVLGDNQPRPTKSAATRLRASAAGRPPRANASHLSFHVKLLYHA
ncbi:hypothetical protein M2171_005397 [Bradyrhizobium japonicum USDA 38]|nr:hypothetical protein [Bradyrhizobium japonicum USDA 38]MCS3948778.1 hypothetical protein [Bradyrhizobium japonicum]